MFRTSSLCDFHAVVDVTTLICLVFQYQIIRTIHRNTTQYIEYNTLKYKYGKLQGKFPALSVVLFLKTRNYSTLAKHKCLGRDHFAPPPPPSTPSPTVIYLKSKLRRARECSKCLKNWHEASPSGYCSRELKLNCKVEYWHSLVPSRRRTQR